MRVLVALTFLVLANYSNAHIELAPTWVQSIGTAEHPVITFYGDKSLGVVSTSYIESELIGPVKALRSQMLRESVRGLPMSVEESSLEAPSLELLGNPSEGLIHVSTNAPTIRIWSSAGELLYAGEASKPLPAHAGTYLVEAISASGTKVTKKAVVY